MIPSVSEWAAKRVLVSAVDHDRAELLVVSEYLIIKPFEAVLRIITLSTQHFKH